MTPAEKKIKAQFPTAQPEYGKDLVRLLAGEILTARGTLMDFPNGISAQSCFAVALPAAGSAPVVAQV